MDAETFLDDLVVSGLMTAEEAGALRRDLSEAARADRDDLIRALVEAGRLTGFQARELAAGRGRALVLGRYLLLDEIGRGGMGVVYAALDRERGIRVALKILPRVEPTVLYLFKQEFRSRTDMVHPNLVTLYELCAESDRWFFAMELVDGVDFLSHVRPVAASAGAATLMEAARPVLAPGIRQVAASAGAATLMEAPAPGRATRSGGPTTQRDPDAPFDAPVVPEPRSTKRDPESAPDSGPAAQSMAPCGGIGGGPSSGPDPAGFTLPFDEARLRAALGQLAEGVAALHAAGKLHRDLKPSNVLVTPQGRVVLLDFGLVADLEETHRSTGAADPDGSTPSTAVDPGENYIVGTAGYMAPEQAAGAPLTEACDWYSVGVMLYEALTGCRPFTGTRTTILREKQTRDPAPPRAIAAGVPEDLDALCRDLLRRRPEDRPSGPAVRARLAGGDADGGRPARPPTTRRPIFVGRTEELTRLVDAYRAVMLGRPVTVLVHGRSGAGKTALVRRFLEGLPAGDRPLVLASRCFEQESVAYKALDCLIDALGRHLGQLPACERRDLLPVDFPALARVFPVLRRVAEAGDSPGSPDPRELRRRAFGALRRLLARIGERRPLILALDDLHWGDRDSGLILADLLRPPDPPPMLLLASYRNEDAATSPCLRAFLPSRGPDWRDLPVEALTPAEATELGQAVLGRADAEGRAQAERIARESGGNPYLIAELAAHLDAGADPESLSDPGGAIDLDAALRARYRRLSGPARRLLEVVTLAGRPIRQRTAYEAAGLGAEGLQAETVLRTGNLVRSTGPRLDDAIESYHDRIREGVAADLAPEARRLHHHALATALEAAGDADAEALAVHHLGAGAPARAAFYYARAADEAAEALAFERATALYQRALELHPAAEAEEGRLRRRLGDALANAGRGIEAAEQYRRAADIAAAAERRELQRLTAFHYCVGGQVDAGRDAFAAVLDAIGLRLPRSPRHALAALLAGQAWLRLRGLGYRERPAGALDPAVLERVDITRSVAVGLSLFDLVTAGAFQTRNVLLALRAGEPYRIALALAWEAAHATCAGGPGARRAARLYAEARTLAERLGHPHALGLATIAAGCLDFMMGRFRPSAETFERAERILRERGTGVSWEIASARSYAIWALLYAGDLVALRPRFAAYFRDALERGDRFAAANMGTQPGTLLDLAAGDPDSAAERVDRVMAVWTRRGFGLQHHNEFLARTTIDLYAGRGAEAYERARRTWSIYRAALLLRVQHIRIDVRQTCARAALAAADAGADPAPLLKSAHRHARALARERMPWADALARLVESGIAACEGRSAAQTALEDAVRRLDAVGMNLYAHAARRRLGQRLGGDRGRALLAESDDWMARQQVGDPERMAAVYAPGFAGR